MKTSKIIIVKIINLDGLEKLNRQHKLEIKELRKMLRNRYLRKIDEIKERYNGR
jgi:hypothetical protein